MTPQLPALATAAVTFVLLAAFWRAWLHRRFVWEWVAFLLPTGVTALGTMTWPAALKIGVLPGLFLLEVSAVLAVSTWKFAPDWGQSGWAWVWNEVLSSAFHAGLGVAAALLLLILLMPVYHGTGISPLLWLGAIAGLALAQWTTRPRGRYRSPPAEPTPPNKVTGSFP